MSTSINIHLPADAPEWAVAFARSIKQQVEAAISAPTVKTLTLTPATTNIITTIKAITDGSGSMTATLLNAPTAGNPTKWISINDGGTIRKIPSW